MMTIGELIKVLETLPQDMQVKTQMEGITNSLGAADFYVDSEDNVLYFDLTGEMWRPTLPEHTKKIQKGVAND